MKMGFALLSLLGLVAVAGTARADLAPSNPRAEWNAKEITSRCAAVNASFIASPASIDAACKPILDFCAKPLDTSVAWTPFDHFADLEALAQKPPKCNLKPGITADKNIGTTHGASDGASWQSSVIAGLIAFIVDRAKAEALASVVQHVQKDICGDDKGKKLLATTCGLLGSTDPYTDPIAWSSLKGAFEADAKRFPEAVIRTFIDGDRAEPLIALADAIVLLEDGAKPIEVLVGLRVAYAEAPAACTAKPYSCALWMVGEASEILDGADPAPGDRAEYFQVAGRLLYEAAHQALPAVSIATFKDNDVILRLRTAVTALTTSGTTTNGLADAERLVAYRAYRVSLAAVLGEIADAAKLVMPTPPKELRIVREALQHFVAAYNAIREKNYIDAFLEVQNALNVLDVKLPASFTKYSGLIVEIANAKTTDDAKKAIEAAAAPVGSWRRKRGAGHHLLALQAYAGIQAGAERLSAEGVPSKNNYSRQGGLFAPVGIEMSQGFAHHWSAGVLVSALDLGALIDVRSSGDNVATASQVGFRQVFSPGAYGLLGLGDYPLTLGVGFSMSPELRTFEDATNNTHSANALRISVFLAIDVPIFTF